jgi:hypothetical protein
MAAGIERGYERLQRLHQAGHVLPGCAVDENRELVTTDAVQPPLSLDVLRDFLEELVAGLVAAPVIELLQPVNIQQDQAQTTGLGLADEKLRVRDECPAVADTGQFVTQSKKAATGVGIPEKDYRGEDDNGQACEHDDGQEKSARRVGGLGLNSECQEKAPVTGDRDERPADYRAHTSWQTYSPLSAHRDNEKPAAFK